MKLEINASNVFALAEDIERSATDFYQRAAKITTDPNCRELFKTLAAIEEVHEDIFFDMRREGSPATQPSSTSDSQGEFTTAPSRLSAQVIKEQIEKAFQDSETSEQILHRAMDFERQTVILFKSLRDSLKRRGEQNRVNQIIGEEMDLVLMLAEALASARPAEA